MIKHASFLVAFALFVTKVLSRGSQTLENVPGFTTQEIQYVKTLRDQVPEELSSKYLEYLIPLAFTCSHWISELKDNEFHTRAMNNMVTFLKSHPEAIIMLIETMIVSPDYAYIIPPFIWNRIFPDSECLIYWLDLEGGRYEYQNRLCAKKWLNDQDLQVGQTLDL